MNLTTVPPSVNPDYYTGLLFARLMGVRVLATSVAQEPAQAEFPLRSYCHCARGAGGGVALLLINLKAATIGPHEEKVSNGHFSWGRPPFAPDVDPDVTRVEGQPGDCVLFTERLVHSTLPWKGGGERRSLFIKYVPWGMHYQDVDYDMSLPGLSERELEVMEYPSQWLTEVRHKASPFFDAEKEVEGVGPLGLELAESGEEMSLPAARL